MATVIGGIIVALVALFCIMVIVFGGFGLIIVAMFIITLPYIAIKWLVEKFS